MWACGGRVRTTLHLQGSWLLWLLQAARWRAHRLRHECAGSFLGGSGSVCTGFGMGVLAGRQGRLPQLLAICCLIVNEGGQHHKKRMSGRRVWQ